MAPMTFERAWKAVRGSKAPHLLLGNGFSRACRDDIFSYESLFDRADFKEIPLAKRAFDTLGTTDFEVVMTALKQSARLMAVYQENNPDLAKQMAEDAEKLKDVLVRAIAANHPEHPDAIPNDQYGRCKKFLSYFDRKFTLNYDLLLYWAVMRTEVEPKIQCDDGFRTPEGGKAQYVSWEPENTDRQNMYYLHGALHIFDAKVEIQKFTWTNTGIRLIQQIREALDGGLYPLFVAEGESDQKVERIRHSDFLDKTYRSLLRLGSTKAGGAMFVYGHSLAPNDEHVLGGIVKSNIDQLFIGIYGDPESEANQRIIKRAQQLPGQRKKGPKLEVDFYDSSTVSVWK